MKTTPITDYDIQAYVDEEINGDKARRVKTFIEENTKARARYEQLCRQKELLKDWWSNRK